MSEQLTTTSVPLQKFWPRASSIMRIDVPKGLWKPDMWAEVFAAGLEKVISERLSVSKELNIIEAGVGAGTQMAGIMQTHGTEIAKYVGCDVDPLAVYTSMALAKNLGGAINSKIGCYQSDLLMAAAQREGQPFKVDYVFACIPQIPNDSGNRTGHIGDVIADVAEISGDGVDYSFWKPYGLDLNARLLHQTSTYFQNAHLVLNIAGRPGCDKLEKLFDEFNYQANIVHEAIVPQDPGTSLQSLVNFEGDQDKDGNEIRFKFYDSTGDDRNTLDAHQAHERMQNGQEVYHDLYVIEAIPL